MRCGRPERTAFQAPDMNAFAERWVQIAKRECLSKLILFGEDHLRRALSELANHYHSDRPHQGICNERIAPSNSEQPPDGDKLFVAIALLASCTSPDSPTELRPTLAGAGAHGVQVGQYPFAQHEDRHGTDMRHSRFLPLSLFLNTQRGRRAAAPSWSASVASSTAATGQSRSAP